MFGSLTRVKRRRGGAIYGEVSDVSLEASFRSELGGVEEEGSMFELEVPARVSSGGDRANDISVKICGDEDCEGSEDMLAYY